MTKKRQRATCGADFQGGEDVMAVAKRDSEREGYVETTMIIAAESLSEQVPAILLRPQKWNGQVAIWISPHGKAGAYNAEGKPIPAIQKLVGTGMAVLAIDLFGQGEFTDDGNPIDIARLNENGRGEWAKYAGYTFGYKLPGVCETRSRHPHGRGLLPYARHECPTGSSGWTRRSRTLGGCRQGALLPHRRPGRCRYRRLPLRQHRSIR